MIPVQSEAKLVGLGSVNRNSFFDTPRLHLPSLQLRRKRSIFIAGQLTGVEGYVESAAMGLLAGVNASRIARGKPPVVPPPSTAFGGLVHYVSSPTHKRFQPMNVNFGLLSEMKKRVHKTKRRAKLVERAKEDLERWIEENGVMD